MSSENDELVRKFLAESHERGPPVPAGPRIRVLVVDDSVVARRSRRRV